MTWWLLVLIVLASMVVGAVLGVVGLAAWWAFCAWRCI